MPNPEEQSEICKLCGQPVTAHSKDCSLVAEKKEYDEKIHEYKIEEGLSDKFIEDVKTGKITYDKQMQEVDEYTKNVFLERKENKTPEDYQKLWNDLKEELTNLSQEFYSLKVEFSNYSPVITVRIKETFDENLLAKCKKAESIIKSEFENITNIQNREFDDYVTAIREISRRITQERLKINNLKNIIEEIKNIK